MEENGVVTSRESEDDKIAEEIAEKVPESLREEFLQAVKELSPEEIARQNLEKQRAEEKAAVLSTKKNQAKWSERIDRQNAKLDVRLDGAVGITRKNKSKSKKSVKIAKQSRKNNRGKK